MREDAYTGKAETGESGAGQMKWVLLALFGTISFVLLFATPDISGSTRLLVAYIGCCIMLAARHKRGRIDE